MDRVTWDMYVNEDPDAFAREKEAQVEGKYASHVAADKMAEAVGKELSPDQLDRAGQAVHYAIGMAPAMLYAVYRDQVPLLGGARGLVYGAGLFLAVDEVLNPILGLTSGPTKYPWQAHVRGLVGHLVLGVVTDAMIDVLNAKD
jgi:uncharacterized membrane protein YagU involved in acid resistance